LYEENRVILPVGFLGSRSDSFIEIGAHHALFPITVDGTNEDFIEIVPVEVSAGYLRGYADPEYIELSLLKATL
jgi:hypothetical protein